MESKEIAKTSILSPVASAISAHRCLRYKFSGDSKSVAANDEYMTDLSPAVGFPRSKLLLKNGLPKTLRISADVGLERVLHFTPSLFRAVKYGMPGGRRVDGKDATYAANGANQDVAT